MSIRLRPISANLMQDGDFFSKGDPYVKVYFGGQNYRTAVCHQGGRNPFWNDQFTLNPTGDTNVRLEVWDDDNVADEMIGAGAYNLMQFNGPRLDNQYVDLYMNNKMAGRIIISLERIGMQQGFGGQQGGWGQQPQMGGGGWGQQPPMGGGGWGQQPPMGGGGGWGQQPPMGGGGWGGNNGW